ncbi:hypothetical protein E2C01_045239 [Portunus trituberculatus]|uniref:Uncharacterized protein n=1 Tax=Portunus trituberculatus TaxID=210409 RepID=A0A5B7G1G1_PORTR|nr:hypothetical protein [Portunus trituberculatus]
MPLAWSLAMKPACHTRSKDPRNIKGHYECVQAFMKGVLPFL